LALSCCYSITHGVNGTLNVEKPQETATDDAEKNTSDDVDAKQNPKRQVLLVDVGANTTTLGISKATTTM
jgi:hypothetical protein